LQWAARQLTACVRANDTVSRQGGDEFIVMVSEINRLEDVAYLAQKLLTALAAPCEINGQRLSLSASIGISLYPGDGIEDADALLKCADIAMYHAKSKGRGNYQFFTAELNTRALTRMTLENSLRNALQREEFFLVYQPVVDLHSGFIIGMEALLRWRHPQQGLIPPGEFISIAEETGLIVPIGNWVLRTACQQAQVWHAQGFNHLRLAVNLSTRQFNQHDLVTTVAGILRRAGLPAQCLELEITESLLIENVDSTLATMHELTALGVSLAIDDFGTGYSSLTYLKRIPINTLKIDRSFILDVATDPSVAAITSAVIDLAHKLGIKAIAEGVEDAQQLAVIQQQGCDAIQGYYFSTPLTVEEFQQLLRQGRRLAGSLPVVRSVAN
ncbi:MAG: bifunctional diguanylate cyclase/phosphodiesterase, partial [Gammaproteobacteria bacterium]